MFSSVQTISLRLNEFEDLLKHFQSLLESDNGVSDNVTVSPNMVGIGKKKTPTKTTKKPAAKPRGRKPKTQTISSDDEDTTTLHSPTKKKRSAKKSIEDGTSSGSETE